MQINDVRYGSRLLLSFFILKIVNFCEYSSSTFSPKSASIDPLRELRRSSRHVYSAGGTYGEGSVPLATSPAAHLLRIYRRPCGSQSARATARPRPPPRYFPVLRFFGAHSASALRRRRTSWFSPGSRLLANSDFVAIGAWSVLTLAQRGRPSAQGHKRGDTLSHARCHQDTPGTP